MIVPTGRGKYMVTSESGKRLSSSSLTKAQAHKRLAEIDWFKAHPKKKG
jgi:hypothetical protein